MRSLSLSMIIMLFAFSSCTKENTKPNPQPAGKIKVVSTITPQNETITVWSNDSVKAGYNKLFVTIQDANGKAVQAGNVTVNTMMDMVTMSHSSPYEQPVYNSVSGTYEFAVIFTMPSTGGTWHLVINVNTKPYDMVVNVPASATKLSGSYVGNDANKYVVALVPPQKWEVGMNDISFVIYKMVDMMHFVPVDNLDVVMVPEMPSMGHGSPNNVNPVSMGNGYYKGKVNYTMTGDWRLHLTIGDGDVTLIADAAIDILF